MVGFFIARFLVVAIDLLVNNRLLWTKDFSKISL